MKPYFSVKASNKAKVMSICQGISGIIHCKREEKRMGKIEKNSLKEHPKRNRERYPFLSIKGPDLGHKPRELRKL